MLKTHGIQVFFMSPQRQFISLDFELTYPWFQITLVIQDTYQVKIQRLLTKTLSLLPGEKGKNSSSVIFVPCFWVTADLQTHVNKQSCLLFCKSGRLTVGWKWNHQTVELTIYEFKTRSKSYHNFPNKHPKQIELDEIQAMRMSLSVQEQNAVMVNKGFCYKLKACSLGGVGDR